MVMVGIHYLCPYHTVPSPTFSACTIQSPVPHSLPVPYSPQSHILCLYHTVPSPTFSACTIQSHILCLYHTVPHSLPVPYSPTFSACTIQSHILCLYHTVPHFQMSTAQMITICLFNVLFINHSSVYCQSLINRP